jgi:hypothetical protein
MRMPSREPTHSSTRNQTYSAGITVYGVGLSSQAGYTSTATIRFHFNEKGGVCGNNSTFGEASPIVDAHPNGMRLGALLLAIVLVACFRGGVVMEEDGEGALFSTKGNAGASGRAAAKQTSGRSGHSGRHAVPQRPRGPDFPSFARAGFG